MSEAYARTRRDPRERLRSGFLGQAVQLVQEWAVLLDRDAADVAESARHELVRMADTADSLNLAEIGDAARHAAGAVAGSDALGALERLIVTLRSRRVEPCFPTIAVVSGDDPDVAAPLACASEPIRSYASVDVVAHEVRFDDLQAALVPGTPRAQVRRVAAVLPGRTYAFGPPDDPIARQAALDDGALAWFDVPLDPEIVLGRVRADAERRLAVLPRVVVAGRVPDALTGLVDGLPAMVTHVSTVADLIDAIRLGAELVVVAGDLGDAHTSAAVRLVRGYPTCGTTAVVVVGHAPEHATADEVLAATPAAAARLAARLEHPPAVGRRDPLTGLPSRATVLADLDAELARARRTHLPLSVALVDIDQLEAFNRALGPTVGDRAVRLVADVLRTGFRSYDLVGRVGGDAFLVALSGCTAAVTERRMQQVQQVLADRAIDPLSGLTVTVGIADSSAGLSSVLEHADRALLAVRSKGRPGAVGVFR